MSDLILPPPVPRDLPVERLVGITTTVPVEVIFAADLIPVDLNNLFITSPDPDDLSARAERAGFPRTCCCWTKGLYGAVHEWGLRTVLAVTRGDCSNAEALAEVLADEGVRCIAFDYPREPDPGAMQTELERLCDAVGARMAEAEDWRHRLRPARDAAARIDALGDDELKVHGIENHLWQVSASDFCADPQTYLREADSFLERAGLRKPNRPELRLGLCGVPPIVPGLYDYLEEFGAWVVYNETQRQFAMPGKAASLAQLYTRYTYPYGIASRLEDIRGEFHRRGLDGLIHYVQSFCHRRIEDRILREHLDLPILTIEGDRPGTLSGQLKTRLEAFVQMLSARKRGARLM